MNNTVNPTPRLTLLLTFAVLLIAGCSTAPTTHSTSPPLTQTGSSSAPTRLLFVGNSYLYYNDSLHNHVERMVAERAPEAASKLQFKSATIGGARLSQHPIDTLLQPGRLGVNEPFDSVILQGGSFEPLTPASRQAFSAQATAMAKKIRAAGSQVALYMTHAYVKPHRRYDPAMIDKVESLYVDTGQAIGALVIPVGLAFQRAYQQRPDIVLHKPFDGSHPSLLGTYLAACVVYASVYQQPATGLEYTYFGAVSASDARFLQQIADETVNAFF